MAGGVQPRGTFRWRPQETAAPGTRVGVPGTGLSVPGTRVGVPGTRLSVPGTRVDVPGTGLGVPGTRVGVPGTGLGVPETRVDVPGTGLGVPGTRVGVPGTGLSVPGTRVGVPAEFQANCSQAQPQKRSLPPKRRVMLGWLALQQTEVFYPSSAAAHLSVPEGFKSQGFSL
uniref:Uncharacterized protein n=1 Tax=Molossus molossus TaxID=27622 RepID=A0A7J8IA39_MOLMO|nr:hypothetical protein HJG59_010723 [Molossus molossus]